jgi:transcriptional regulator
VTYLPPHFAVTEPAVLHALVQAHPLATWVVLHQGELLVNHVPFFLDATRGEHGTLIGHVARANPVWQAVQAGVSASVLVFQGPTAYVSPSSYPSKKVHGKVVPTYNYAVVHAHGVPRAFEGRDHVLAIVSRLTQTQESKLAQPWQVADAPTDYIDANLKAIVGIEFDVQRWVGKWKVSQNRSEEDRQGVAEGFEGVPTSNAEAMAGLVRNPPG